ncbi:MAG: acyl transferase [Cytophagales bacterium]|nr:acyl transferase [Bernardetiaceae bacterium]MDW8203627.1 acyl transferase [Cytophagales bacterium]
MQFTQRFKTSLQHISPEHFEAMALAAFRYQAVQCKVYAQYLAALRVDVAKVHSLQQIPFMPIDFFKHHRISSHGAEAQIVFESSGTTGSLNSRHYIADPTFYSLNARRIFEYFYGNLANYHLFALLPSYLEKGNSSLVFMAEHFMQSTAKPSGFFLHNFQELAQTIQKTYNKGKKIILLGVTYALLDFAEHFPMPLPDLIVMETGGMKGRRREIVRQEVHDQLRRAFACQVHSEYGMTELLSQCYAINSDVFQTPPQVRILLRDLNDPFSPAERNIGGINVIDLANIDSCCFIETQDIGQQVGNATFRVLGRYDNSDVRGCNLLVY